MEKKQPVITIEDRVKDIVVDQLGVDRNDLTDETLFIEDLGADSLDGVEIVMGLEEEFGIEIPEGEEQNFKTLGDVVTYLTERNAG